MTSSVVVTTPSLLEAKSLARWIAQQGVSVRVDRAGNEWGIYTAPASLGAARAALKRAVAANNPGKRLGAGDKHIIRQMVGRLHVGASDDEVVNYVRSRVKNSASIQESVIKQIIDIALKEHRRNQGLYRRVTSGRLNSRTRKNPIVSRVHDPWMGSSHKLLIRPDIEHGDELNVIYKTKSGSYGSGGVRSVEVRDMIGPGNNPRASRNGGGWYYGMKHGGGWEVFRSKTPPTEKTHGRIYASVTGPRRTKEECVKEIQMHYTPPFTVRSRGKTTRVNPRARRNGSTKGAYPFKEKAAQYRAYTPAQLLFAQRDAHKAAMSMKGHDAAAEAWYFDDFHTITDEINRRRHGLKTNPRACTNPACANPAHGHGVSESERRRLTEIPVFIDGKKAKISGVKLPFAKVHSLDGTTEGEWAWETAKRIALSGGSFKTNPSRRNAMYRPVSAPRPVVDIRRAAAPPPVIAPAAISKAVVSEPVIPRPRPPSPMKAAMYPKTVRWYGTKMRLKRVVEKRCGLCAERESGYYLSDDKTMERFLCPKCAATVAVRSVKEPKREMPPLLPPSPGFKSPVAPPRKKELPFRSKPDKPYIPPPEHTQEYEVLEREPQEPSERAFFRAARKTVPWRTPGLTILRVRLLSDKQLPFWVVAYAYGSVRGEPVKVQLPFQQLPKRGFMETIVRYAIRDGVWAKRTGIFQSFSKYESNPRRKGRKNPLTRKEAAKELKEMKRALGKSRAHYHREDYRGEAFQEGYAYGVGGAILRHGPKKAHRIVHKMTMGAHPRRDKWMPNPLRSLMTNADAKKAARFA